MVTRYMGGLPLRKETIGSVHPCFRAEEKRRGIMTYDETVIRAKKGVKNNLKTSAFISHESHILPFVSCIKHVLYVKQCI